jgi:hypothetical protein
MASFREKAEQCYRLARTTTSADIADRLTELAREYEAKAELDEHGCVARPPLKAAG